MSLATLPYIHAAGDGGTRTRTQMIVVHDTGNTAGDVDEAKYASWRPDRTSAHVYADGDSAVRALDLSHIAYGCHPTGNGRSVQFELVQSWTEETMRTAAPLVAEACRMYGIPVRKISPEQLRAGELGICGHADVTLAWHEGDHMDPGPRFNWGRFIDLVAAAAGASSPAPAPAPAHRIPPFGLPGGHCYGNIDGPAWCHGGHRASDQPAVRAIQNELNRRGFNCGKADGEFGPRTIAAAKAFQRSAGLKADGLVGVLTWSRLFG